MIARRCRPALAVLAAAALCACDEEPLGGDAQPGATRLVILVTDGPDGPPLPARVVLYDDTGEQLRIGRLEYLDRFQSGGACPLADGAYGTWEGIVLSTGSAEIPVGVSSGCNPSPAIPFGKYRARVTRGIEYEFFDVELDLRRDQGPVFLVAPIERAFEAEGTLAGDLHVHAGRSNDTLLPPALRVITEMAAGIQVLVSADHNVNGNFQNDIDLLGAQASIAAVPGNELSIDLGHFNIFPIAVDSRLPRGGALDPAKVGVMPASQLFAEIRNLPQRPLLQVNHPRYRWGAYFDSAHWDGRSWPPPMPLDFDTVEILTGINAYNVAGDERLEEMVTDFYTLAKNGVFKTAVGSSDTHHLSGVLAGMPRSYVYVDDPRTDPFDQDAFLAALRNRRVVATTGPWLDVVAGGGRTGETVRAEGGVVKITIGLRQASFVHANRIRVWIGGEVRYVLQVPEGATRFDWTSDEPVGATDTWIGVDAAGDIALPIEITGDDLWQLDRGGMKPRALINPILVDADGDGAISLAGAPPLGKPMDVWPVSRPAVEGAVGHCGCSSASWWNGPP